MDLVVYITNKACHIHCHVFVGISPEAPTLGTVAMALSGFTLEKNALWRQTCCDLRRSLGNPYLQAIFSFLASKKSNYDDVLVSFLLAANFVVC